jgi:hypothetical protein
MNPLRTLENTLASLVEGAFGRIFRAEVRPMEIARKLTREMDEHRTTSVSRVYAPNEFAVWLSPEDRARYEGVEHDLIDELCAYLLEHARAEQLTLVSQPVIAFHTDDTLALGEFGIQARLVRLDEREPGLPAGAAGGDAREGRSREGDARERGDAGEDGLHTRGSPAGGDWGGPSPSASPSAPRPPRTAGPPLPAAAAAAAVPAPPLPAAAAPPAPPPARAAPEPPERGHTMIYSSSRRLREPLEERPGAPSAQPPRALLLIAGRRLLVAPGGAVIGRSRECDVVLDDAGVSRRHARLAPTAQGWAIEDLRSTNGVRLNDAAIHGATLLRAGDRIEVGSTGIVFELR